MRTSHSAAANASRRLDQSIVKPYHSIGGAGVSVGGGVSVFSGDRSATSGVRLVPAGIGMGNKMDVSCNAHSAVPPAKGRR